MIHERRRERCCVSRVVDGGNASANGVSLPKGINDRLTMEGGTVVVGAFVGNINVAAVVVLVDGVTLGKTLNHSFQFHPFHGWQIVEHI